MCFVFVIFVIDPDDLTSLNKRAREQWVISLSVFHHAAKMKIFYLLLFFICLSAAGDPRSVWGAEGSSGLR